MNLLNQSDLSILLNLLNLSKISACQPKSLTVKLNFGWLTVKLANRWLTVKLANFEGVVVIVIVNVIVTQKPINLYKPLIQPVKHIQPILILFKFVLPAHVYI